MDYEDHNKRAMAGCNDEMSWQQQFQEQARLLGRVEDIREKALLYLGDSEGDDCYIQRLIPPDRAQIFVKEPGPSLQPGAPPSDYVVVDDIDWKAPPPSKKRALTPEDFKSVSSDPAIPSGDAEAPDCWIDDYIQTGFIASRASSGSNGTVKAELKEFSGSSLDWFEWIDLFRSLIHSTNQTPGEKLAVFKLYLNEDLAVIVKGLGGGESAYKEALRRVKEMCGRRDVMRAAYLQALDRESPGGGALPRTFAERIRTYLFNLSMIGGVSPTDIIEKISSRLQLQDRLAWNDRKIAAAPMTLTDFGDWLCARSSAYQSAYDLAASQVREKKNRAGRSNANFEGNSNRRAAACTCCEGDHALERCDAFRKMDQEERMKIVSQNRLCFTCLNSGHSMQRCKRRKVCGVGGCRRSHHPLIHRDTPPDEPKPSSARSHASSSALPSTALGAVRINVLDSRGQRVTANLFLDPGSDTTLVREGFLRRIGITGPVEKLDLLGVAGSSSSCQSQRVVLKLLAASGDALSVKAASLRQVCAPLPKLDWAALQSRWHHLAGLPLQSAGGEVDILLGEDNGCLMLPLELRAGADNEPYAFRTKLGWVVRGPLGGGEVGRGARINFIRSEVYARLDQEFLRFCNAEDLEQGSRDGHLSPDDKMAVELVESSIRKLDIGYEVALPWRKGEPTLSNNFKQAENRLSALRRRFQRDPVYEKDYIAAMDKYFVDGYATKLEEPPDAPGSYFLPHHGVYKRGASKRKLRIVFDSAAKHQGKCLNDALLPGPALQSDLPTILLRFREGAVAFTADIEAMFSRVRIRPEDALRHRFLWYESKSNRLIVCQMNRLAFGSCCSPFVALFILRRAAIDYGDDRHEAVNAILQNFYMDDCLFSAASALVAIQRATQIVSILAPADFHLRGFVSNSAEFLAALNVESLTTANQVSLGPEVAAKVLGVGWKTESDNLCYLVAELEEVDFTLVGLTSLVARMFDPLGLASPLTVKAKIRLRSLGLRGLKWQDPVNDDDRRWWEKWIESIKQLKSASLPRCLFPSEADIESSEMHTFTDASEEACAAVVYIRNLRRDGSATVHLAAAKNKLAPKKTVCIGKLELMGAVVGSRLAQSVQKAISRPIARRRFWTDSSNVRGWVRATASHYKTFVGNRIGQIQDLTDPGEWRFVPGHVNIADAATRSSLKVEPSLDAWISGPDFLRHGEESWPSDLPWAVEKEERRSPQRCQAAQALPEDDFDWASWQPNQLDVPSMVRLDDPWKALVIKCQAEFFAVDLRRIRTNKPLKADSRLLSFAPFIDPEGLLRYGGRIGRARLPFEHLHPVILPGRHPLSDRIIDAYHLFYQHSGVDYVLSHLRQHFWMLRGREAVKGARQRCKMCVRGNARPAGQMMADLPVFRLEAHSTPFTNTAVDYFGPIDVCLSRNRTAKRYGVLFTCLVTRAVYVDLAQSLSTPDFLLVLRRFIGTYGQPRLICSDNGTNFVGAERELREEVERLNADEEVKNHLGHRNTTWKFQPPSAPHFGGAHERLVRSVKTALYKMLGAEARREQRPTEELLRTLFFEVAGLLNARPLTYTSSDAADFRPLTPNDFLNRRPVMDLPTNVYADALPRESYRYLRHMLNAYWSIWQRQYLQSLAGRSKWTKKSENLCVGDVVLICDSNVPRGEWRMGRIVEVFPGRDGLVRVARVTTETGDFVRPIHRLCLLESAVQPIPSDSATGEDVEANPAYSALPAD